MLKVKGFQVAPAELEGCLLGHPDIVDSCVVGIPDVYSGEIPRAYVVVSDDAAKRISLAEGVADDIKLSVSQVRAAALCNGTRLMVSISISLLKKWPINI